MAQTPCARDAMLERYADFFRTALCAFRVNHCIESLLVEEAIQTIATTTESIARRWLFAVRVKTLAARLRRDVQHNERVYA